MADKTEDEKGEEAAGRGCAIVIAFVLILIGLLIAGVPGWLIGCVIGGLVVVVGLLLLLAALCG